MASPSPLDLMLFHKLERDFYKRLVGQLNQDRDKVKWVMALWLWLESIGHHDFIRRVSSCRPHVILGFVKEADACVDRLICNALRSIEGAGEAGASSAAGDVDLPLTSSLMAEEMSMRFFDCHQDRALKGTRYYFNNVCKVIFDSPLMEAVAWARAQSRHLDSRRTLSTAFHISSNSGEASSSRSRISFPDAGIVFPIAPLPVPPPRYALNPMAVPWTPSTNQLSEDQRSMFITFSRGHPIPRDEIAEFFNMLFGNCVDAVMIEKTAPGVPPMYGRLVLTDASVIPAILNGQRTAKFMINGRHLWARMYVSKNNACMNL